MALFVPVLLAKVINQVYNENSECDGAVKSQVLQGGFMSFFKTEKDKEMLLRLKKARAMGITSMRVVGRGTIVMDHTQLANTNIVREARRKAKELVCS